VFDDLVRRMAPVPAGTYAVAAVAKSIDWRWTVAELIVLIVMASYWKVSSHDEAEKFQRTVAAVVAYGALLLIMARVLGVIWPPLVTISFALAGASLLLASRHNEARGLLLKLAGLTMVVVVGRLLVIDLSSVETIWRVLLFLVCGTMFVYTSYRLQPGKGVGKAT